jgi:hypothetical protein
MAISESQLVTWSHQGSITQSSATYNTIKNVLAQPNSPYTGCDYKIFLQGSYGNDTNIYSESDVDIVIQLETAFYHNIEDLSHDQKAVFASVYPDATYGYYDFKKDVMSHLTKNYSNSVKDGKKAIQIEANGSRRKADLIVAIEYRNYSDSSFLSNSDNRYETGICFYSADNTKITNYPKQHSANCTTKHQSTNQWFKPMVRILKNMRGRMAEEGMIEASLAPSYYIEGLLYNVPNNKFGKSYDDTFVNCINWIVDADRNNFVCANEQYYLLRENSSLSWRDAQCTEFLRVLCDFWKQW